MSEFVRVAKLSEIPDPGKRLVEIDDRLVVLFHVGGQVWAIDDVCTHDGGPLVEGELDGDQIECPRHGARFNVKTGAALSMPAFEPVATHEVKVEGSDILVKLSE
jgi:3-phenylpropionate/trans-cinnamate dioxygenase ferredoxin subunit